MNNKGLKSSEINNGLDGYSTDEGGVIIINPNTVPVKHEDLFIYATLKARARTKSLITVDNSDGEYLTEISFLKGLETSVGEVTNSDFLTTNWTNIGGSNFQTGVDYETFGMTSIDINLNAGFIPTIIIEFTDVRGATLFEQGSCSPYAAFYHQPYPIFELTVKGYYGSPVTYYLAIQKFTTSFDPQSGNYKSRGEFIGYSYAFLSDILLGHILAAPYMDSNCGTLEKVYNEYLEYFEKHGFNKTNPFNPISDSGDGLTLFEYVTRLTSLVTLQDGFDDVIRQIQNLESTLFLNDLPTLQKLLIENVETQISEIFTLINNQFPNGGYVSKEDPSWDSRNTDSSPSSRYVIYYPKNNKRLDSDIRTHINLVNKSIETFNKKVDDDLKIYEQVTPIELTNEYEVNFLSLERKTEEILNKLLVREKEQKTLLSKQSNEILNRELGFVPTIRSFFTTLLANTEVFLRGLLKTSYDAENYHSTNDSTVSDDQSSPQVRQKYFAWPEYRVRSNSGTGFVERYPGVNPKNREWPEVRFIEEFYDALLFLRKKLEEQTEEETYDYSQYENVPGRDDYFAINALETPAGQFDPTNNYYNLNDTNQILKAIWDRFLITSNFSILNEPILENNSIIHKVLLNRKTLLLPSTRGNSVYSKQTFDQGELGVLGQIETWNLVSSLRGDSFKVGYVTTNSQRLKELIEDLEDFKNKNYDLILSPKSKDGGKSLKPNIHQIKGEELFKINKLDDDTNTLDPKYFSTDREKPSLPSKTEQSTTSKYLRSKYNFGLKNRDNFNKLTNLTNVNEWFEVNDETGIFSKPEKSYDLLQNQVNINRNNDKPLVQNIIKNFDHGVITTISYGGDLGENRGFLSKTSNFSQQNINVVPIRPILDIYPDYYFPYKVDKFNQIYEKQSVTQGDLAFRYHEYGSVELTQSRFVDETYRYGLRIGGVFNFTPNVYSNLTNFSTDNSDRPNHTWSYEEQHGYNSKMDPSSFNEFRFNIDPQIYSSPILHPLDYNFLITREELNQQLRDPNPKRSYRVLDKVGTKVNRIEVNGKTYQKPSFGGSLNQMNTTNNGNLITESPFWRHNFPSILSESNQYPNNEKPHYFTYYEAQWGLVKDSPSNDSINIEHRRPNQLNPEIKENYSILEGFPIGARVDLDWWSNTSRLLKYQYENGPISLSTKRHILTNHNKQETVGHTGNIGLLNKAHNFKVGKNGDKDRWLLDGFTSRDSGPTNYNKTKVWKGSLAYLWLANHFHRPWTGMWDSDPSWYGPVQTLAQSSIVAGVPKSSLLLLGAVLWRMRESGLFISDDDTWNLPPNQNQITYIEDGIEKYLDPINHPIVAKKIKSGNNISKIFNTKYFGWENHEDNNTLQEDVNNSDNEYRNNGGVRPPTASLFGFDRLDFGNKFSSVRSTLTCFPAPDEWPTLNLGVDKFINIEDSEIGYKNPFKNQYKIFQPIFKGNNSLMLRFRNQGVKWLLREENVNNIETELKGVIDNLVNQLKRENFSDSSTQKIIETTIQNTEESVDTITEETFDIFQGRTFENVTQSNKRLSGLDESYTKFSLLQHNIDLIDKDGFTTKNSPTIENGRQQSGYFRGYLPIGPELWFLPTKVKEIIIKEFEDYVGDFNNYDGSSDFDKILEEIDPLNFPYPEKYLKRDNPDAFKGDIVIQTTLSEAGEKDYEPDNKGKITNIIGNPLLSLPLVGYESQLPEVKSIIDTEWDKETTRGSDCKNCVDFPKPLKKWRENFGVDFGGASQRDGVAEKINEKNQTETPSLFVYNNLGGEQALLLVLPELLGEFTVANTTPRIWWAETKVGDNDYFFDERQWQNWVNPLIENLSTNQTLIDEILEEDLSVISEQQVADNDIKLDLYRSFKSIYDKWISASSYDNEQPKLFFNSINSSSDGDRLLIDHFSFVNRVNQDIGDKVLINIEVVSQLFNNTDNSLFGVTSDVLDNSNFLFFPLPSYVDLTKSVTTSGVNQINAKTKDLSNMFRPVSTEESFETLLNRGPHYLCMFIGSVSKELNLSRYSDDCENYVTDINKHKDRFKGDSFNISNVNERPEEFSGEDHGGIVAFKVAFGSQNQNHFIGVNLDQSEYKNTSEALRATELISQAGDPANSSGFITKSQSLYEVFLNRSYSCTVESMGNMMIQPLQYFELENVPMFVGTYLIRDISHKITPHNMKTTFKGDRIPQAEVPLIEDIIAQFDLSQVNVTPSSDTDTTSTSSSGGGSSSGSRTGGSTNPSSNPVDLSKIPDSRETDAIKRYLEDKGFFNEINEVRFPDPTYDYPKDPKSNPNGGYAKRDTQKDPGQFHNNDQPVTNTFEGIMLHFTAGWNNGVGSTIKTLLTRANPNSEGKVFRLHYHIIVDGDGKPHQICDLNRRGNHGGVDGLRVNQTTLGLSYQGGIEKGNPNEGYTRTWEDWQNPSLNLTNDGNKNKTFNAKKQWESLVDSILYMKTVHPQLKYITSHEWVTSKFDVGSGIHNPGKFPWDKLISDLQKGGWNEKAAGGDPYIKNDWGVSNSLRSSENINKDYLLQSVINSETDQTEE